MQRFATPFLWLVLTILMLVSVSYSQNSANSIGNKDRAEIVSLCEKAADEVIVSREIIKTYEDQINLLQDALDKGQAAQELSDEQIGLQKAEIGKVREALSKERDALASKELEVVTLRKALSKEIKKKNFYKSLVKILGTTTAISVAVAAAVILKE
jgi:hypothetical protein